MLIIGSAGRNTGKTFLAAAIIKKLAKALPLVGLKVTTIREKDGSCPRGGEGCGVCSSLEGDFCVTEETNPDSAKDTSRLLAAGASRVFWLRAMKDHLAEGIRAFLESIPDESPILCESNSARSVVDPGLFLMTKKKDENEYKSSAKEVCDLADRIVSFDGTIFDLNLEDVSFYNGNWALRERAAAIVLAGGKSSRMGEDKSLLPIQGKPMIERLYENLRRNFDQVLISSGEPEKYAFLGAPVIPDKFPEQGPLMGIASAMAASTNETNFFIACDIPDPNLHIIRKMLRESEDCDAVVPVFGKDRAEPLFAVYKKKLLPLIQETLSLGKRRILDFFEYCDVKKLKMDENEVIMNINTIEEYKEYKRGIGGSAPIPPAGTNKSLHPDSDQPAVLKKTAD